MTATNDATSDATIVLDIGKTNVKLVLLDAAGAVLDQRVVEGRFCCNCNVLRKRKNGGREGHRFESARKWYLRHGSP